MPDKHFVDLDLVPFTGATVILDVDGTLVIDGVQEIDARTEAHLRELATLAKVYLCSNARPTPRLQQFAESTGAMVISSPYMKPNVRVLQTVPEAHRLNLVVIGDKYLTDGVLARRTGARFIKVKRLHFRHERLGVHLAYAIDAVLGRALFWMARP